MPDAQPIDETDFSAQMQALAMQAEQSRGDRPPKPTEKKPDSKVEYNPTFALAQLLRPLILGMESVMRVQGAQSEVLQRIDGALGAQAEIPEVLSETRQALEQRNSVSRAMFDALHTELKGYKDDFLRESVLRPVIRDLISLYDDTRELHRQLAEAVTTAGSGGVGNALQRVQKNLEHHVHYLLEILERLDVKVVPPRGGKLDKHTQKVVAREPAATPDEDLVIARSAKPGFTWRERLFRPEEVVVKKWGIAADASTDADGGEEGSA
jgi:molecular chaperone GrpE (heat shock protein)